MTHSWPDHKRRAGDEKRRGESDDIVGIILRAVALAALALGIGLAASLLVDTRHGGDLGVPALQR
jgi:hypothetical protein